MTANDRIATWKTPSVRADLAAETLATMPLNPAGLSPFETATRLETAPVHCAGGLPPNTIVTIVRLTSFLSCNVACTETMWDGSCDFFTYGCCH
jgi:mersacidin/lichenicidin family type 2 lantibiotic